MTQDESAIVVREGRASTVVSLIIAMARTYVRTMTGHGRHLTRGDASQVGSVATAHD